MDVLRDSLPNRCFQRCSRAAKAVARWMKYWEIIADNLSKAGWSWGCVSAVDSSGRTIWIVDAHRDDGKRFIVHADEKLTAFWSLKRRFEPLRIVLTSWRNFLQTRCH